jgi:ceramide glucosyltransferase
LSWGDALTNTNVKVVIVTRTVCMVQLLLLILCVVAIAYYGYATYAAVQFFAHSRPQAVAFHPPITILKPLCGLDSDAYTNLASFCQQAYPTYQVLFGVSCETDPVIPVVKQLIHDYPQTEIQLIVDDRVIGSNLKVSNLANIERHASYDLLLMSDSDIWVGSDYLQRIVQPMQNLSVGVVTCLYRSRVHSVIAALEAIAISTDFHPSVLVAHSIGWVKFAMGSTILIRRPVLEKIGGFAAIADYLADDFMLGNLPTQVGYTVTLSDYVVDHTLDTQGLAHFLQHQNRWNCCTRVSRSWGYLGLIVTHGTAMSIFFLLATHGSWLGWGMLVGTWMMRLLMGWIVGVIYLQDTVVKQWFWLLPFRDLISFGLWLYSWFGSTVMWRGQPFKLTKSGKLISLDVPAQVKHLRH